MLTACQENPEYIEHRLLLKKLHDLNAQGNNSSPEADAIRELMEPGWYKLSELEKRWMERLSADLYLLSGEETFPWPSGSAQMNDVRRDIRLALRDGQFERAWRLLSEGLHNYDDKAVARYRALVWQGLGDPIVASWFTAFGGIQSPEAL